MVHLLQTLSRKYNKEFEWKFIATSHGKGVVDGIGGNAKSLVRCHSMGKSKNKVIMQNVQSFATVVNQLMKKISVHLIFDHESAN